MTHEEHLFVMELELEIEVVVGRGSNLGQRRPRLPLGMAGGKSS